MSEAVINWATVMAAIETTLASVQNSASQTAFKDVILGEPMALPLDGPYCCVWYIGRTLANTSGGAPASLANVMYAARLQIMVLWPMQGERSKLGAWEADIATIDTGIRRALRADSTVNSSVTDLVITDSQLSYGDLPVAGATKGTFGLYRVLQMELLLDNLEGEAIEP